MEGNMAIYGFVRSSPRKNEELARGEMTEIARKAGELGGSLTGVFVDPGPADETTAVLKCPAGKEMLETLQPGDTLIVTGLDRLGYSTRDLQKTMTALCDRKVRIYALRALNGELELSPEVCRIILDVFALLARTEKTLRSERAIELALRRKENGLAYGGAPIAMKIVQRNGVKVLEWDMKQMAYIAEIARRLPREGAANVAKDFWKRKIKDGRGRLWGKQTPRFPAASVLSRLLGRHYTPYQQFVRAARWFRRMKSKGQLPPPYGSPAELTPEPHTEGKVQAP
jgi:DNA invertase Pin-like site-specific DNA recombinase